MTDPQGSTGTSFTGVLGEQADSDRVRLYGPEFQRDPAQLYRDLRREYGPVAPILLDGDVPAWLVLGYREIYYISSNPQLFARNTQRWNGWDATPENWSLLPFVGYQPSLMFTEGPEHQRRAGAVSDALDDVDRLELKFLCEQVADRLVDAFAGAGEVDLMTDFAHPVPALVVARLLGLDDVEARALTADLTVSLDGGDGAVAAHMRVAGRMQELLARKRSRPGSDVPSRLIAHQAGLTDEELVQDLLVVLAAAQQPTANWIGNTLRLMLTDTRFAVTLSGGRRSVGQALAQVLWQDTPTQNFIGRFAVRATNLAGKHIAAGDMLVLGLAAANTDPQVYPAGDPGETGNRAHLSFGHGEHGCPYPAPELAGVIAQGAVEVLLDRLPDLELTVPAEDLAWRESVWMRGLHSLPVRFTPV
ncbi:MAG TPA: cytochrome P450 [Pseudonocardiaceae bacterium]|jgi:cytochrome P450|nr:cytochrome P450 [Pseudonocardiaceae bacterium]